MPKLLEPYRIKVIEPIRRTTPEERLEHLKEADYNLFKIKADDILIDYLTDSGTSAMSSQQWAAIMIGDESYAGAKSFYRFQDAVRNLMPFKFIFPTHQGRAAERILFDFIAKTGLKIPSNTHFDTTRGNIEMRGAQAIDLVIEEGKDPACIHPFKGNMDIHKLDQFLANNHESVPIVMLTITNNSGGGQPVSIKNISEVKAICQKYKKPLFLDACRFAENAYFIKQREKTYAKASIEDIVRKTFSFTDGMTMSAKKDALVNIGGWLALNDESWARDLENILILGEGFPTYGGLAGRDLDAMATGLQEIVKEDYLKHRIESVQYLGEGLRDIGVPVMQPIGGHAVYIDAKAMLPHIPPLQYPGHALAVALYQIGGIRACEIGSLMFGAQPDGTESAHTMELVRLAVPRRVYTQSHFDYTIECFEEILKNKDALQGFSINWQPPHLRHFTVKLQPIGQPQDTTPVGV